MPWAKRGLKMLTTISKQRLLLLSSPKQEPDYRTKQLSFLTVAMAPIPPQLLAFYWSRIKRKMFQGTSFLLPNLFLHSPNNHNYSYLQRSDPDPVRFLFPSFLELTTRFRQPSPRTNTNTNTRPTPLLPRTAEVEQKAASARPSRMRVPTTTN